MTHLTLAEQVRLFLPRRLFGGEPLQSRRRRRRLVGHLHHHVLPPDWSTAERRSAERAREALFGRQGKNGSPGQVEGQSDIQGRALEAVLRAHRKLRRLSMSAHRGNLQVFGVQSLHQISQINLACQQNSNDPTFPVRPGDGPAHNHRMKVRCLSKTKSADQ